LIELRALRDDVVDGVARHEMDQEEIEYDYSEDGDYDIHDSSQ
jgi:hypothetical protein